MITTKHFSSAAFYTATQTIWGGGHDYDMCTSATNITYKNLCLLVFRQQNQMTHKPDAVVAKQYKENYEIYRKTANHWAQTFAGGE